MGSLTSSERVQIRELKNSVQDLAGFIDGSFKNQGQTLKAGIGCIIYNKNNDAIFTFSGPITAVSSFNSECQALSFMLNSFLKSPWKDHELTVHSDCRELVLKVLEIGIVKLLVKLNLQARWKMLRWLKLCLAGSINTLRREDRKFQMDVNLCDENANALAAYLADHGARNYKTMVFIAQPFGRVFEIWNHDMGLGPVEPQFMAVNEEDVGPGAVNDAEVIEQDAMVA
ncbi:hypothetical protein ACET3Z_021249 [Daucus carota]